MKRRIKRLKDESVEQYNKRRKQHRKDVKKAQVHFAVNVWNHKEAGKWSRATKVTARQGKARFLHDRS